MHEGCLSTGQGAVNFRHPRRQLFHLVDEDVVDLAVHVVHVFVGLTVDGDAEGMHALSLGFQQGVTGVLDRVLLHCYAGCEFSEIAAALGMQPHEFFADGKAPKSAAPGVSMRSLNTALALELITAYVVACDRSKGKPIGAADLERERVARQRITTAWRAMQ